MRLLKRTLRLLKRINNLHRQVPLWRIWRHWKMAVCALIVCGAAAEGGLHFYRNFKQHRLLDNAAAALRRNDARGAAIFAMRVLGADPKNILACKILAEATDKQWPRDALVWHARLDELQPGDPANYLAWARTALRLGDTGAAGQALDKIRPSDTNRAEYQWLAGKVALSQRDYEEAAADLAKAAALSPDRMDYAFELAKVRLLLPEGETRQLGLQSLETLAAKPDLRPLRVDALRTLAEDAVEHRRPRRALEYFTQLDQEPGATPQDRLRRLAFLLHSRNPAFAAALRADEEKTVANPVEVANLAFWMNENDMPLVAIEWVTHLPVALRSNKKLQLALALSYVAMSDWSSVRSLLEAGDWKDLEFLRVALLARCFGEEGDAQQAQDQWNLAVLKASDNPESLGRLCETVQGWGWRWESESEDLAWRVIAAPHPLPSILDAMQTRFVTRGETRKFRRLLLRWREIDPVDRVVRNNLALVSMLLNRDDNEARQAALKLFQENPSDGQIGSTYAFSLYLQGRASEALDVMSRFPNQLKVPSFALYNGVFLTACGEPGQAEQFLALAKQAPILLPEERDLLAAAEASAKGAAPAALETGTAPKDASN